VQASKQASKQASRKNVALAYIMIKFGNLWSKPKKAKPLEHLEIPISLVFDNF